jgi:hypothetical protein
MSWQTCVQQHLQQSSIELQLQERLRIFRQLSSENLCLRPRLWSALLPMLLCDAAV